MGLADVTLFMVTAGCSLQWTATAAATGPSSLIVWLFGVVGMFLPISVSVVFLSAVILRKAVFAPGLSGLLGRSQAL
jgi:hypothetical protein